MKRTIISGTILTFCIVSIKLYDMAIENIATSQNTLNLNTVVKCINSRTTENTILTENEFADSMEFCARNIRSIGKTGDMFAIRQSDAKIVWDASADCSVVNKDSAYLSKNGICKLFSDPVSCEIASLTMVTEPPSGAVEWLFDDSDEIVNYVYYRDTINNNKYIIASGTQTDEVSSKLKIFIWPVIIFTGIILILNSM